MNFALQKTLELILIIGLGLLLQKKVAKQDLKGIKVLILSVALPATIFVALLKIELKGTLLVFPIVALIFNLIMLAATKYFLAASLHKEEQSKKRTLMMLLPSTAPGLSCFPFIVAYLGDDTLALAALADIGNKIFVLILLYMLAMHWYRKNSVINKQESSTSKLKGLFISLINEPINLVIVIGLIMLGLGLDLSSLPTFFQNTALSIKDLMTPLVLLFIGMAVRINKGEFKLILSMLLRRMGLAFLISGVFAYTIPALTPAMILLLVVFPQSACSFWPFAHMSAIQSMEEKDEQPKPTFDVNFGLNILACSLPFSTLLIIGIFSFSEYFINPLTLLGVGAIILGITFAPDIFKSTSFMLDRERKKIPKSVKPKSKLTIAKNDFKHKTEKTMNEAKAS
ncbi:AEC family transporter [Maribacter dokdonensis]|uniref:AEC family transporter n=1 Tax=Maribacter dokdonensis TaxID=320912 RepID=UPI0027364754|nr:AEC family transporter [Maribacter dokdonensis]MDP2525736.1 AEC family transporter [Maribacter dokdonensis]